MTHYVRMPTVGVAIALHRPQLRSCIIFKVSMCSPRSSCLPQRSGTVVLRTSARRSGRNGWRAGRGGCLACLQVGAAAAVLLAGAARRVPLTFAAVKASLGHCEPAAGAAGVLAAIKK